MKVAIIGRGFGASAMKPAFEACGWQVEIVPSREIAAVEAACAGDADLRDFSPWWDDGPVWDGQE